MTIQYNDDDYPPVRAPTDTERPWRDVYLQASCTGPCGQKGGTHCPHPEACLLPEDDRPPMKRYDPLLIVAGAVACVVIALAWLSRVW